MVTTHASHKRPIHPHMALMALFSLIGLVLLNACTSEPAPRADTTPVNTNANRGAPIIPVGMQPEITVKSMNAIQLTFVGTDKQSISTDVLTLPYQEVGNKITIDFGSAVLQPIIIKIPYAASLNVIMGNGNVAVDTIQGQVTITLISGTIRLKNFTPHGSNTIQMKNGTIDVTFMQKASCNVRAQTNFGAITSGYPTISEKRSAMKAEATGTIGNGSGATVHLIAGDGSITIRPA